ncbi:MAG: spore germination protein [Bacillaceae bacterium]|nr:spore germination protein [Bacillaceae bacterium]
MKKLLGVKNKLLPEQHEQKQEEPRDLINNPITLQEIQKEFENCSDIKHYSMASLQIDFLYFKSLISKDIFEREILNPLNHNLEPSELFTSQQFEIGKSAERVVEGILDGNVAIFYNQQIFLLDAYEPKNRAIEQTETESTITGAHDAFIEGLEPNLSLIRKRVKSSKLKIIKLRAGEVTKTDLVILYIEDIANEVFVNTLKERISAIEIDAIYDTDMFVQLIDEHPNSIFPQFNTTERPDVVVNQLVNGKVVGLVDNSPTAFIAPTNFFEFFDSPDDKNQRWAIGTATKLLRYLSIVITITFTAFYVAVTTYHYEMIPETLLLSLAESRHRVPFPPLLEALIMEITIELLREAGARLPTKIGQTIGIVGGIVIGQAAVQAGLVSNTLIIAVAISAIASFVLPSYMLSASIRIARFGLIILAGALGNFGLLIGIIFILLHLVKVTSLQMSYLTPVAPIEASDLKTAIIRAPYWADKERTSEAVPKNKIKTKFRK